jgi:hypothetical protein
MVQEFIRKRGVTTCPGFGTPEFREMNIAREKARAEAVSWMFGASRRRGSIKRKRTA